jgi:hypothetical protein
MPIISRKCGVVGHEPCAALRFMAGKLLKIELKAEGRRGVFI